MEIVFPLEKNFMGHTFFLEELIDIDPLFPTRVAMEKYLPGILNTELLINTSSSENSELKLFLQMELEESLE